MPAGSRLAFFFYFASLAPACACANEDWVDDFSAIAVDPARVIKEALAFTGSRENAEALVEGLRAGSETVLREPDSTIIHFQPPTGPLGYGNVSIAISLAQTSLSVQGVVEPSAQQVAAALVGGEIFLDGRWIPIEGALALRAQGLSWGEVAEALGFTLGDAVSVAGAETADQRRALAQRRMQRQVEIVERSISTSPELRIVRPERLRSKTK